MGGDRTEVDHIGFQLTRPVWGEPDSSRVVAVGGVISTHSPRVGRTSLRYVPRRRGSISTHSPRVGRTLVTASAEVAAEDFNSLAPCGANLVDPADRL